MSKFCLRIAKPGVNVDTAQPKDLIFDSLTNDTQKIVYTGRLSISLPSETINADFKYYTDSYTHNLGYAPMFYPVVKGIGNSDGYGGTVDWNINDESEADIPPGAYGFDSVAELADLVVNETEIKLNILRYNLFAFNESFGAKTVFVDYTILYNQVDEEYNYL